MNKKFFSLILSIILPLFIVSAVVYSASTIGNAITVGTTLTVTGTTTLNDGIVIGDAATDKVAILGQLDTGLVWAATSTAYGLDFDTASTTLSTADIRLQNGATINNNAADTLTITEGTVAISGNGTISGTFGVSATSTLATTTTYRLGVSTTTPGAILDVADSSASSTVRVGASGQIGCLALWSTTSNSYGYIILSGGGGLEVATTAAAACGF